MDVIDTKTEDYMFCHICDISSLGEHMCPCPRGGCGARIEGTVTTIITLDKNLTEEQQNWNKENYR